MKVHDDILKMAKTREKREHIKWLHIRRTFFHYQLALGLELARLCEHEEARLLVSLFPNGAPKTRAEARAVFLCHQDDARCLGWATWCGGEPHLDMAQHTELVRRSATGGFAPAMFEWCGYVKDKTERMRWLERAAAQGEPLAMVDLAGLLWSGREAEMDRNRAEQLLLEAAELGEPTAQADYANTCCAKHSLEWFVWMRRSAAQNHREAVAWLKSVVVEQVDRLDDGGSGRFLFEIGAAFAGWDAWRDYVGDREELHCLTVAVKRYEKWCGEARRAVRCWLWLSRSLVAIRDVRVLIADSIWDERAAWSERAAAGGIG